MPRWDSGLGYSALKHLEESRANRRIRTHWRRLAVKALLASDCEEAFRYIRFAESGRAAEIDHIAAYRSSKANVPWSGADVSEREQENDRYAALLKAFRRRCLCGKGRR